MDAAVGKPAFAQRDFYSNKPPIDHANHEIQFGNKSKLGNNWLGGPTNNIKAQHLPGYAGYVPLVIPENLFGKSFAKTTAAAINGEVPNG